MRFLSIPIVALLTTFFLGGAGSHSAEPVNALFAQQVLPKPPWTGKTAEGDTITKVELTLLLADHLKWLETNGKEGKRFGQMGVNLAKADLSRADLTSAYFHKANLSDADLSKADLTGAYLFEADLSRSNLRDANLKDAILAKADLKDADLSGANLGLAGLGRADLSNANLRGANLNKANLRANLNGADLQQANLIDADLRRSNLREANLREADLQRANLSEANLFGADLSGVNLFEADLRVANLKDTDLTRANLSGARMGGVNLSGANLSNAVFEPHPNSLPPIDAMAAARGLAELWYENAPQPLVRMRKSFKEAGYRRQEREIAVSLRRSDTLQDWRRGGLASLNAAFTYVFFDLTCKYGLFPWRPLALAALGVLIFFPFYCLALVSRRADTGIWLTWPPDRTLLGVGQEKPEKLTTAPHYRPPVTGGPAKFWWHVRRVCRVVGLGFYFSLLSALSLSWRAGNFGPLLSRLQAKEYALRPTGWVRTLAGLQSLSSAFLLIIWAFLFLSSLID